MRKEKDKEPKKVVKILKIALEALLGVMVVAFLALFIMSKATASPIFLFNRTTMWVMTESMDPTIPPRTYILVEKATAADVEVGDIVVFRSTDPRIAGQFNTHRVIAKDGDTFVTKGDNNPVDDGIYSAQKENIVGKYVDTLTFMTYLGRLVMTPVGFALLIVLFLATMAFCVVPDVKSAFRDKKKEDEEEKQKEIRRQIDEEVRRLKESGAKIDDLERERDKKEEE